VLVSLSISLECFEAFIQRFFNSLSAPVRWLIIAGFQIGYVGPGIART